MARGVAPGKVRASGETVADETAKKEGEEADKLAEVHLPEEDERKFRTPGFSRMRVDWRPDEITVIQRATSAVEGRILTNFRDAYEVMNMIYELVRTPEVVPETGEPKRDQFGYIVWKRTPSGGFDEDFTRLSIKQKENLLFLITTRLFAWEQTAGDIWGEAMFAKAIWEERFAMAFDQPVTGTVDDRTNYARVQARDERYFAIFLTIYSRKADAIVRSLTLLAQRLRDSGLG